MINEQKLHNKASEELADTMQEIYHPKTKKDFTELEIQKHQNAIEELKQKKINPEVERRRKQQLHQDVIKHRQEKRISNEILDMTFSQMTGQGGVFPFKK